MGNSRNKLLNPDWKNHGLKPFPQKDKVWNDTNGKAWKIKDTGRIIGTSEGKESQWVRVEYSGGTIHGHPISLN